MSLKTAPEIQDEIRSKSKCYTTLEIELAAALKLIRDMLIKQGNGDPETWAAIDQAGEVLLKAGEL